MRYVFFDEAGRIISAHNDDTVDELPSGAVELTDAQWDRRADLRMVNGQVAVVDPDGPTFDELKDLALSKLNRQSQAIADKLISSYPEFEKLTWEDQRREALAWSADNSTPTPYIDGLATERGIDRIDYLRRVVSRATEFASIAQKLVGQRHKYQDQIKSIKVEEGDADDGPAKTRLSAIEFVFTLT